MGASNCFHLFYANIVPGIAASDTAIFSVSHQIETLFSVLQN